jgi:hypothetical protein
VALKRSGTPTVISLMAINPAAEMVIGAVAVSAPPFVVRAHVAQLKTPAVSTIGLVALICAIPI